MRGHPMGALSFSKSEPFNRWNLFVCFEKTLCPIFESDKEFFTLPFICRLFLILVDALSTPLIVAPS